LIAAVAGRAALLDPQTIASATAAQVASEAHTAQRDLPIRPILAKMRHMTGTR
jgi:hypothetical protein